MVSILVLESLVLWLPCAIPFLSLHRVWCSVPSHVAGARHTSASSYLSIPRLPRVRECRVPVLRLFAFLRGLLWVFIFCISSLLSFCRISFLF
ncbi:hypothetical protein C8R45DRAFT_1031969 [Mycena sanguinolenta]|nr:hypothetical protein C8R45DRAFT_1031969 [Mycena sanguinolenta]